MKSKEIGSQSSETIQDYPVPHIILSEDLLASDTPYIVLVDQKGMGKLLHDHNVVRDDIERTLIRISRNKNARIGGYYSPKTPESDMHKIQINLDYFIKNKLVRKYNNLSHQKDIDNAFMHENGHLIRFINDVQIKDRKKYLKMAQNASILVGGYGGYWLGQYTQSFDQESHEFARIVTSAFAGYKIVDLALHKFDPEERRARKFADEKVKEYGEAAFIRVVPKGNFHTIFEKRPE